MIQAVLNGQNEAGSPTSSLLANLMSSTGLLEADEDENDQQTIRAQPVDEF